MEKYTYSENDISEIVAQIFEANGYVMHSQAMVGMAKQSVGECDYIAERDHRLYCLEIVLSRDPFPKAYLLARAAEKVATRYAIDAYTPVLVVVGKVSKKAREAIKEKPECSSVVIVSISNLLYMLEGHSKLREGFLAALPFSLDDVVPLAPKIDVARVREEERKDESYDDLIERLCNWQTNRKSNATSYEELCGDVLQKLFAEDLSLWRAQEPSNDGLFRFDLFCKIKHGNNREFWQMAERYFNSKYIVFEFKNYKEKITQEQIFTTVKYLYAKALRSVAIMVAVKGADNHADKAVRGILREEGKLILVLSNQDLIAMLEMKREKKEPSDYLSEKLDTMLISLEK